MHVRNLASNQLTNEDVGTLANRLGSAKNLFPFWVAPPAALDGITGNRLCEIWNRTPCGLEDNAVVLNKCERFLLAHNTPSAIIRLGAVRCIAWLGGIVLSFVCSLGAVKECGPLSPQRLTRASQPRGIHEPLR
jgi:hypothetical protein